MKVKFYAVLAALCFIVAYSQAQTNTFPSSGKVGIGTTTPNTSSLLEIKSTNKGILIPRMTLAQRNAIASPATGLLIYQTDNNPGFFYYSGSSWTGIQQKGKTWSTTGNPGTTPGTNYIGTSDAQDLVFKTNAMQRMRILKTGLVGIGTATPAYPLDVESAGTAIYGNSTASGGYGVWGNSIYLGVYGEGGTYGVYGYGDSYGVYGSSGDIGVYGSGTTYGVYGSGSTYGVYGYSSGGNAVYATSGYVGVNANGSSYGVNAVGTAASGSYGIYASGNYVGVYSVSDGAASVVGNSTNSTGGNFHSVNGYGLVAGTDRSDKNWAGVFNGNTYAYGVYQTSDKNLKKNIKDFGDAMSIINRLKPKTYEFLQDGKYAVMHLPAGQQYGLIAQDLETVLPGLVKEVDYIGTVTGKMADTSATATKKSLAIQPAAVDEKITTKAVNYIALIPIIIKALQEMNASKDSAIAQQNIKINDLQNQVNQLKTMITSSATSQQSTFITSASLAQNEPNPFGNTTTISYTLPQKYSSAKIIISDKNGGALKQVNLSAKGKGSVHIDAATLSSGAYQYSLYVDGRLIDTKQMVLQK
ncbi:MAG TPA: tail fiber domain-containing protein [Chitinophagaceae bacterium]|nr:tail fiber domain-containing protein [Chitinophagaceae bacterium]